MQVQGERMSGTVAKFMIRFALPMAVGILLTLAFWWLSRMSGKIHDRLSWFMTMAKETDDIGKLDELNRQLKAYAKKECWHRHFANHAMQVNNYIVAKAEGLKKGRAYGSGG